MMQQVVVNEKTFLEQQDAENFSIYNTSAYLKLFLERITPKLSTMHYWSVCMSKNKAAFRGPNFFQLIRAFQKHFKLL